MLKFLADDPGGYRIDIESEHITANAVRFEKRRAAAHKRVADALAWKIIGAEKEVTDGLVAKLGEREASEKGTWRARNYLCTSIMGR